MADEPRREWERKSREYAGKYDQPDGIMDLEKDRRLQTALSLVEMPDSGWVLELGVGAGELFDRLPDTAAKRVGADFSRGMLGVAEARTDGATFTQATADRLPFADGSLSLVVCLGVFGHLESDQLAATFAELGRVLADDGQLVISYGNARSPFRWIRSAYFDGRGISTSYETLDPKAVERALDEVGLAVTDRRYLTYSTGLLDTTANVALYRLLDQWFGDSGRLGWLAMTHVVSCRRR